MPSGPLALSRSLRISIAFALSALPLLCASAIQAATPTFTVAGNLFPSTPLGQSTTQNVMLTVNTAVAIKSIALETGFSEYKLGAVSGCKTDGATVNAAGAVCTLSVTFTPKALGSTASPATARTAPLLVTDIEGGSPVTYAFGLLGASTGPLMQFTPATLTRIAGAAATGLPAGDQGLGATTAGYSGDNGPAASATFSFLSLFDASLEPAQPLAIDSAHNLYVIDAGNQIIRRIDGATNTVTTVAGVPGKYGRTGDGGPATSAEIETPGSLALDAGDNLYFTDAGTASNFGSYTIRTVNAGTGIVNSIAGQNLTLPYAGTGACVQSGQGYQWEPTCGDGGLATDAFLYAPQALAIDSAGNLYVLEQQGTIRRIDAVTGIITSIGNAIPSANGQALGMAIGSDGNLYAAVQDNTAAIDYLTRTDPATKTTTIVGGGATTATLATCNEQGQPFTGWFLDFSGAFSSGLSADGAGNVYGGVVACSGGTASSPGGYDYGTFRYNIPSGLAYATSSTQAEGGNGSNGVYVSFGSSYQTDPAFGVADGAGDFYFLTFNQIAEMNTSLGALGGFGSRNDFQTDASGTVCGQYAGSFCETAVVANVGDAPLDTAFTLSPGFSFLNTGDPDACIAGTLAPGDFCNFDIEFTPLTAGPVNGTLTLTDNATLQGDGQQSLALAGTGVAAPQITFSPATIAFGNQAINTTSPPQTVTISNPGTGPNSLDGIFMYASGNNYGVFTIPGGTCPLTSGTLAAGASCTVQIAFAPTAVGAYSAYLNVNNLATPGDGSLQATTVTGAGVAAGAAQAVLSPATLAFPSTTVGSTAKAIAATLSNPGTATLTGIAITLTGANPTDFAQSATTCGATLNAGASCTISITFTPASAASFAATLSVADSASNTPQTASLTGAGVNPSPAQVGQLQFTPTLLNLFAGDGQCSLSDPIVAGPAIDAPLCGAVAAVADSKGNEFLLDQEYNSVLKVDPSGHLTIFAGVPTAGPGSYGGDNGPAASALLSSPVDIVVDSSDNLYISDYGNSRIRKVDATTGTITTYAGYGKLGFFNGGTVTTAALGGPQGMTFDPAGNLYVSNGFGMLVLKIDTSGNVTLFAGEQVTSGSSAGEGIGGYTGDGGKAIDATLNDPQGLASDAQGNIYIADVNNWVIRKVDTAGVITTVAGNHTQGNSGDGGSALDAEINAVGVSADLAGDLYITGGQGNGNLVRKVDLSGNISTYAGGGAGTVGGPAASAALHSAWFARVDRNGDLVIPAGETVVSAGPQGILQFGTQNVGVTSTPLTLTLSNTGNAAIGFSNPSGAAVSGDFAIAAGGTCNFDSGLPAAASCTLNVTFTPTATGARTGTLSFSTNAPNSPNLVQLSGTGAQTAQAATPVIAPGTGSYTTNQTVTITDSTSGAVIYFSTDGSTPTTSSTKYAAPITVSRTGTVVQAIAVAPGYTNSAIATATYTLNAVTPVLTPPGGVYNGPQSVAISTASTGAAIYYTTNGTVPTTESTLYTVPIAVTASGTQIQAIAALRGYNNSPVATGTYTIQPPTAMLSPSALSFGNQSQGSASAAQTLTLKNTSSGALTGIVISLSEQPQDDGARRIRAHAVTSSTDYAATTTCGTTLAAGSTCTIAVTFNPQSVGSLPGTLTVTDNAANSPQTASLSGTGTAPAAPIASLTPATLTFASTAGTASAAQKATLSNTGNAALSISGITLTGANPSDFSQTNTCGTSLAAGSSCTISITFTPASAASFTASLSVADNAGGSPQTASLSGTGSAATGDFSLAATPGAQAVTAGGTATYQVTVATAPAGDVFNSAVTLIASGLPSGATATFSPASVTPGASSATSTLTIQTAATSARNRSSARPVALGGPGWAIPSMAFLAGGFTLLFRRRQFARTLRKLYPILILAGLGLTSLAVMGCGGGFALPKPTPAGQTYTVTITGASGEDTHSTTVKLTVN
jgi:hypothetical protein